MPPHHPRIAWFAPVALSSINGATVKFSAQTKRTAAAAERNPISIIIAASPRRVRDSLPRRWGEPRQRGGKLSSTK